MDIGTWELLSYIVTTIGFPAAILVFLYEQKKERDNEEEEVYQLLSDNYQDFLKIALDHPDLHLFTPEQAAELTKEQRERMLIIFNMLISLFERAYLLLYEPKMNSRQQRRWRSWEDYMREWCRRERIPRALPDAARGRRPGVQRLHPGAGRENLADRLVAQLPGAAAAARSRTRPAFKAFGIARLPSWQAYSNIR